MHIHMGGIGNHWRLTFPSESSTRWWNIWKISKRGWWMVRTTVRPESASLFRCLRSSWDDVASRPIQSYYIKCRTTGLYTYLPEVGSSRNKTLGRFNIWRAITKRLFWPPLNPGPVLLPTGVFENVCKPVCGLKKYHGSCFQRCQVGSPKNPENMQSCISVSVVCINYKLKICRLRDKSVDLVMLCFWVRAVFPNEFLLQNLPNFEIFNPH